jgi:branched-chain amino acid transport system permease protein
VTSDRFLAIASQNAFAEEQESMVEADGAAADRNRIAFARWDKRMRESLRPLITRKLIAEHKRDPVGIHSDALDRVLNYFRRPNLLDRYVIVCTRPFKQWRVARMTGVPGEAPEFIDERTYNSEAKAAHAVFLLKVEQTMRD